MKHMKKVFVMLVAMIMILSMAVSVYADEESTTRVYTKANASDEDVITDHTYKAYQIITADSMSDGKLIGVDWADNVSTTAQDNFLDFVEVGEDDEDDVDIDTLLEYLGTDNDNTIVVAFSQLVYENIDELGDGVDLVINDENEVTTVLSLGYWLIVDVTDEDLDDDEVSSTAVINRANLYLSDGESTAIIVSKVEAPKSDKKIKDINDSETTDYSDWQDSADHDVGDMIPFRLTATLPSDYEDYTTYFLTFHDVEQGGLQFDSSTVAVYLDSDETEAISSDYYTVNEDTDDGCTFEVVFTYENLVNIGVENGSVLIVEYESELTDTNLVYGQKGNPNTSWITYNNNPNSEQGGVAKTPEDTVIVYTYKTVVNKQDKNGNELAGADFTLYKKVITTTDDGNIVPAGAQTGAAIKDSFDDEIAAKADALDDETYYVEITTKEGEAPDDTTFTYTGIDDGEYVIVETVVPDGYNGAEAITLTVSATHNTGDVAIDPETGYEDGTTTFILTELSGSDDFETVLSETDATISTDVLNKQGASLPETGGIGTTMFYTIGVILVVGAGVVLITRRRMNAQ